MKLPVLTSAAGLTRAGRMIGMTISATVLLQGSSLPGTAGREAAGSRRPPARRSGPAAVQPAAATERLAAKLSPDALAALREPGSHGYVLQLRQPAAAADYASLRRAGVHVVRRYTRLPMVAVTADGPSLARL